MYEPMTVASETQINGYQIHVWQKNNRWVGIASNESQKQTVHVELRSKSEREAREEILVNRGLRPANAEWRRVGLAVHMNGFRIV